MKDYPSFTGKTQRRLVRSKKEGIGLSSTKLMITWLILVVIAGFFVHQRIDYLRTQKRVKKLLLEKQKIILSMLPLKLEERFLTNTETVERIAKEKFQLRSPKGWQTISVNPANLSEPK